MALLADPDLWDIETNLTKINKMREIRYSIDEYLTEHQMRWHGTFSTREEAERRLQELMRSDEVMGHLHIEQFYNEYSTTVKDEKETPFQISFGSLNLNL